MEHPNFAEIDLQIKEERENISEWNSRFNKEVGKEANSFETNTMEQIKVKPLFSSRIFQIPLD